MSENTMLLAERAAEITQRLLAVNQARAKLNKPPLGLPTYLTMLQSIRRPQIESSDSERA